MNKISPTSFDVPPGAGVLNPYSLISYLCCIVAITNSLLHWWSTGETWSLTQTVGLIGGLSFWIFCIISAVLAPDEYETWLQEPKRIRGRFLLTGLLLSMLLSVWACRDILQPLFLCVITAKALCASPRKFWLPFLLLANTLVSFLYLQVWPVSKVTVFMLFYVVLQSFIIMVMDSLVSSIQARRDLQRINTELFSTRQLLKESIRTEERLHLSRELHDIAGHKLTALKLQLKLEAQDTLANPETLNICSHLADELLQDIRNVVSTLRENEGIDLQAALRALNLRIKSPLIHFDLNPYVRIDDLKQANALLHCAQEGLTNALRHSMAKNIWIRLMMIDNHIELQVEDDGVGVPASFKSGNGLNGLIERLNEIGGHLSLETNNYGRTILRASLHKLTDGIYKNLLITQPLAR